MVDKEDNINNYSVAPTSCHGEGINNEIQQWKQ